MKSGTPSKKTVIDEYKKAHSINYICSQYDASRKYVIDILVDAQLYTNNSTCKLCGKEYLAYNYNSRYCNTCKLIRKKEKEHEYYLSTTKEFKRDSKKRDEQWEKLLDTIRNDYKNGLNINQLCQKYNYGRDRIIKILVTVGLYKDDNIEKIKELTEQGLSNKEIAVKLSMTEDAVVKFKPYEKRVIKSIKDLR